MDGLKADWTFAPLVVGQRQIVQNAWPAKDVAAASDFGRSWWIQTDRTGWYGLGGLEDNLFDQIPVNQSVRVCQVDGVVSGGLDHKLTTEINKKKIVQVLQILQKICQMKARYFKIYFD